MITQPNRENIKNLDDVFYYWVLNVSNMSMLSGVGSPEGLVQARKFRFYMDSTGTAGNILYIKRNDDISGDRTQGWVLV